MFPFAGGGGFGGSYSSSASTGDQSGGFGSSGFGGGINTGTQGLDVTTIAIIAVAVVVGLYVLKQR